MYLFVKTAWHFNYMMVIGAGIEVEKLRSGEGERVRG